MTDRAIRSMEDQEKENNTENDIWSEKKINVSADDKVEKVNNKDNVNSETEKKEQLQTISAEQPAVTEVDTTKTNADHASEEHDEKKLDITLKDKAPPTTEEIGNDAMNVGSTVPRTVPIDVEMTDNITEPLNTRESSSDNTDALFGDDNSDEDMLAEEDKKDESKIAVRTEPSGLPEMATEPDKTKDDTVSAVIDQNKEDQFEIKAKAEDLSSNVDTKNIDVDTKTDDTAEEEAEKTSETTEPEVVLETLVEMRSSTKPAIEKNEPSKELHTKEYNDVKEGSEIAIASLGVRSHVFANNEERQMNKLANQMIQIQLEKLETKLKIFDKLERSLEFDKKKLERKQEEFLVQRLTFAKSSNLLVKKFDKALDLLNDTHSEGSTGTNNVDESTIKSLTSSVNEMKQLLSRPLYLSFGSKVDGPKSSNNEETSTTEDLENGMKPISIENPQVYRYWSA